MHTEKMCSPFLHANFNEETGAKRKRNPDGMNGKDEDDDMEVRREMITCKEKYSNGIEKIDNHIANVQQSKRGGGPGRIKIGAI